MFITENEINFLAFPHVTDSLIIFGGGYGFETLAEELSVRLARRGHDVTVYARRGCVGEELSSFQGVRVVFTPTIRHKYLDTVVHGVLLQRSGDDLPGDGHRHPQELAFGLEVRLLLHGTNRVGVDGERRHEVAEELLGRDVHRHIVARRRSAANFL